MTTIRRSWCLVCLGFVVGSVPVVAQDKLSLHTFERKQLTNEYFSEGANAGDLNNDGHVDAVYGPHWYEGPAFEKKHEIYSPKPQNREGYSDHFFAWVHDFNGDGWKDVFTAGFPGTPGYVYENPKAGGFDKPWKKHQVFDWVSNESPHLTNLIGDERPELVCTRDGFFGFATVNWEKPLEAWTFHAISEQVTATKFGHGLGVGDVNGDGRLDVIHSKGWLEQPAAEATSKRWASHDVSFTTSYGGAEMFAYDVDGDGDNDIITSDAAHDFGLAWYEQVRKAGDTENSFVRHLIMGSHPSENRYGVLFSELHSLALADIDGDGLKDIVTGKTYYSHHKQSPLWDAGAVVYWFKLVRKGQGARAEGQGQDKKASDKPLPLSPQPSAIDWVPYQADGEAGIGRQVSVVDVNGDKLPDIVVGGMKGGHVLTHKKTTVDQAAWDKAQPKLYQGPPKPSAAGATGLRGPRIAPDAKTGRVAGALEGESLKSKTSGGEAKAQKMGAFKADRWSGDAQLFWTGAKAGDTLELELPEKAGTVDLDVVLTCAKDYAIVQLSLDGKSLGKPIDLYDTQVVTSGVLTFPKQELKAEPHTLAIQIVGANKSAVKNFMVGVDYVRLRGEGDKLPEPDDGIKAKSADGRVLNLDFETGTLDDWKAEGTAFAGQPIKGDTVAARRGDMRSGHRGNFWIGGFENKTFDPPTGTLTSAPFLVTQPFASFLTNGGEHNETRVELVRTDTNAVFFKVAGENSEELRQVVVDLRAVVGKEIVIRLVDEHKGGWGHLNFDHFRFHSTRPAPLTPALTKLVTDEYPHSGLSAAQAALAMTLPPGFRVTVGAAEPDVTQPIAMALDDRGRVWIAEAYEYPLRAKDKGRDRILIFEDRDGDGSLETRKVFIEGLNLVSGLEVGFGGVWVGAAPYLLFIPDRDGDDVPDGAEGRGLRGEGNRKSQGPRAEGQGEDTKANARPSPFSPQPSANSASLAPQPSALSQPSGVPPGATILLDGWGYQDTHETLNAFIWGPDGWLYGCHGVFTHSEVGKPGTAAADRTKINAGIWRYHPTRHEFEVFAHGTSNPWGVDFNDHGQAFATACVIPHLFHIIPGARYQRQAGPHFNKHTYRDITTIADHLHYLGATPHGGNNKSDEAGGGHAHAGAMIYLGGAWPAEYRNQLFMNNIHGQRLNVDIPKPRGSGYVGTHGPDFLKTGDRASQILNLRYGPDGQAWMIDWYDMQACHTGKSDAHDRSNGRIYKISHGESKHVAIDLKKASDLELAELTLHGNDWHVRHARKVMQERAASRTLDLAARGRLTEIATTHADDTRRLRAMWAMHVTGGIEAALTQRLLGDASEYVRGWTIQLAQDGAASLPDSLVTRLTSMARDDKSQVVRLFIASALQKLPFEQRWSILSSLAAHAEDASDHNLPLMYWYAAEPLADVDAERALAFGLSAGSSIPLLRDFMLRRIGSSDAAESLPALVRGLGKATQAELQLTFLQAIRTALQGQRKVTAPADWAAVSATLAKSDSEAVHLQARALGVTFGDPAAMSSFRELAVSKSAAVAERREAIDALLAANDKGLAQTLQALIDEPPLRDIALRGLAQYDDPKTASVLLAAYPKLSADEKRAALGTLCSRTGYALALLGAIEKKQLPGTDLTADLVRQLQYLKDDKLQQQLGSIWGTVRETAPDKAKLIESLKQMLASPGPADATLGRAVFAKTCQRCHILYGLGNKIGPDLTGSNRSNLDYLLSNIVDPSAVMAKEYQQTVIATDNGRVLSGIVRSEDAKSVTLQTAEATVIIPKNEIEDRVLSDKSMMPDDQLKTFSETEVRSLVAYLTGKQQVPMLATKDNAASLFNGKDLAGWHGDADLWSVENGEIVGRTPGLKHNEWIVSDLSAADFKFTVEVKLVRNEGNSGIQFRSEKLNREVKGYQADIGAGWWGKLYEEHGRALLWDKSGEKHVQLGDWNTYEVEARGSQLRTRINGQLCVDLDDPKGAKSGILAFQLHSGGATEVRYRNLRLEISEPSATVAK